jgi:hypothetical protein
MSMQNTREVWKVSLAAGLTHELPMGAKALYADYQAGEICVWLFVDPSKRKLRQSFFVTGTGWSFPDWIKPDMHIGSCRNPDNVNCWHIFHLGYTDNISAYDRGLIHPINPEARVDGTES